jgi:hypothetical protein
MLTERSIINALIIAASCILAPYLISSALTADNASVLLFVGLCALVASFCFLKDTLCMWPFLGSSISGSLNFLPLPLNAAQIFCILLIAYYFTAYIAIRQKRTKLGKPQFFWPIFVITSIVLFHNHSLHVHVLGSETEGGKPAFLIYITVLAYFCGINVTSPSTDFLCKFPFYCLILAVLSNIPYTLTTYIPSLAPYALYITDAVNIQAYQDAVSDATGEQGGIGRVAVGPVAETLQLYLICYYPILTWWRPERWWLIFVSLFCLVLVILSGYRNVLFSYLLILALGTIGHYSIRSFLIILSSFAIILILVFAMENNVFQMPTKKLPLIAQRTLSFLPLDWNEEAIKSAEDSNDFRQSIQEVYIKENLKKHPWFGNGFDIDTKAFNTFTNMQTTAPSADEAQYYQAKSFIESKQFHTGWLSIYDAVGLVGFVAFLALAVNEIRMAAHLIFEPKVRSQSSLYPLCMWLFVTTVSGTIGFFTVFGDFKAAFIGMCITAIVLSHIYDIVNSAETSIAPKKREWDSELANRPF